MSQRKTTRADALGKEARSQGAAHQSRILGARRCIRQAHRKLSQLCPRDSPKQIISLGAGLETTFWRLSSQHRQLLADNLSKFIELDLPEMCARKIKRLQRHSELFFDEALLGSAPQIDVSNGTVWSERYALCAGDLKDWTAVKQRRLRAASR